MAPPRFVPSDSILRKWRDEGLTVPMMVERIRQTEGIEVSPGTVYSALSRAGLTEAIRYTDFIPWSPIRSDHAGHYALVMLRLAARRESGQPIAPARLAKLQAWEHRLGEDHAVVTYVHESPDGFYYVPAREGVDTGLIRVP